MELRSISKTLQEGFNEAERGKIKLAILAKFFPYGIRTTYVYMSIVYLAKRLEPELLYNSV